MRFASLHGVLRDLAHDRRGVVGLYFSVILSISILLSLAAIDLIRTQIIRARVSTSMDAALLAAGRALGTNTWQADGVAYFNANMASSLMPDLKVTPAAFNSAQGLGVLSVTMTVETSVAMMSKAFGNISSLPVRITSSAERRSQTADVAMVLDNTGSMGGTKITALTNAANRLLTILATEVTKSNGQTTTVVHDVLPYAQVALVPYSASVNIANLTGLHSKYVSGALTPSSAKSGWRGCVVERAGKNYTLTNLLDTSVKWQPYVWAAAVDNNYIPDKEETILSDAYYGNSGTGPNIGCPSAIVPLNTDRIALNNAINGMQAWSRGGTLSDIGLAWGLRVLTPTAGNVFGSAAPFFSNRRKVVVLLTDGDAQYYKLDNTYGNNKVNSSVLSDYTGYGRLDEYGLLKGTGMTSTPTQAADGTAQVNKNLSSLCTSLKNGFGVEVYTITFMVSNQTVKDNYGACASPPTKTHYFDVQSVDALNVAFDSIGGQLTELVLTK